MEHAGTGERISDVFSCFGFDAFFTGLFPSGGFSLLEAGGIRKRNVSNVLFKNLLDTVIAAISYYCVGYAFAYGEDVNGFIGRTYFALSKLPAREFYLFFFQFAFVATAATIVSGGAAGRCSMIACKSLCWLNFHLLALRV